MQELSILYVPGHFMPLLSHAPMHVVVPRFTVRKQFEAAAWATAEKVYRDALSIGCRAEDAGVLANHTASSCLQVDRAMHKDIYTAARQVLGLAPADASSPAGTLFDAPEPTVARVVGLWSCHTTSVLPSL